LFLLADREDNAGGARILALEKDRAVMFTFPTLLPKKGKSEIESTHQLLHSLILPT
jgi:hypothetical protein